jgi:hypothetical protein
MQPLRFIQQAMSSGHAKRSGNPQTARQHTSTLYSSACASQSFYRTELLQIRENQLTDCREDHYTPE